MNYVVNCVSISVHRKAGNCYAFTNTVGVERQVAMTSYVLSFR